jgi:Arc/MetJ-type ribon-helix-helix transcriptional regulator
MYKLQGRVSPAVDRLKPILPSGMTLPRVERITVTLPNDLVREIDRREKNRSRFVAEAVRRELDRRRRAELQRSLQNPHPESAARAERGLDEWASGLPEEDAEGLVDNSAGRGVRWMPGEGWVEDAT